MRLKITISLQEHELKIIDEHAKTMGLTRSGYLKKMALFGEGKCLQVINEHNLIFDTLHNRKKYDH